MKDFMKITKIIFILAKKQGKVGKYLEKQFFWIAFLGSNKLQPVN